LNHLKDFDPNQQKLKVEKLQAVDLMMMIEILEFNKNCSDKIENNYDLK